MAKRIELDPYQQWYAEGAEVFELARYAKDDVEVTRTVVARITGTQVVTVRGTRFWRFKALRLVGERDKQLAGVRVPVTRLVPPGHPQVQAFLAKNSA